MPDIDITCFIADLGGVATVGDLADFLQVSEREVRAWALENGVARAGNAFAFTQQSAQALADDLAPDDDEDEDDDGPDDDDSDDDDSDDDGCDADDE